MPGDPEDQSELTELDRQALAASEEPDVPLPEPPTGRAVLSAPGDAVPVAYLPTSIAAHMVKCILEGAGIRAAVVGEHSANTLANLGPALTVTLLVSRGDFERAVKVLHETIVNRAPSDLSQVRECPICGYDLRGLESKERCPECGSQVGTYLDLRRHLTIAPRPVPAGSISFLSRAGAFIGLLILAAMVVIGLVAVFGGVFRR
jgi:hypothetical protein